MGSILLRRYKRVSLLRVCFAPGVSVLSLPRFPRTFALHGERRHGSLRSAHRVGCSRRVQRAPTRRATAHAAMPREPGDAGARSGHTGRGRKGGGCAHNATGGVRGVGLLVSARCVDAGAPRVGSALRAGGRLRWHRVGPRDAAQYRPAAAADARGQSEVAGGDARGVADRAAARQAARAARLP